MTLIIFPIPRERKAPQSKRLRWRAWHADSSNKERLSPCWKTRFVLSHHVQIVLYRPFGSQPPQLTGEDESQNSTATTSMTKSIFKDIFSFKAKKQRLRRQCAARNLSLFETRPRRFAKTHNVLRTVRRTGSVHPSAKTTTTTTTETTTTTTTEHENLLPTTKHHIWYRVNHLKLL